MSLHRHFIIYKPIGYLSQFIHNEQKRRNKKMLGELHHFPEGTMSIGRLDKNSEGLLLLTTDGKVSFDVRQKSVEKEYFVQCDGLITDEAIDLLKKGVEIRLKLSHYTTLPCAARKIDIQQEMELAPGRHRGEEHGPTSWVSITITEGKFRQVRKMTAAVGFPTLRLIRVRIGNLHLNGLKPGAVLEVDAFDYC
jgi:23S rRNA pseudouridine2457 synthase